MLGDGLVMVSLLERRMMYDVMNNEYFFELTKNDEPTTAMLSAHAASSVNN